MGDAAYQESPHSEIFLNEEDIKKLAEGKTINGELLTIYPIAEFRGRDKITVSQNGGHWIIGIPEEHTSAIGLEKLFNKPISKKEEVKLGEVVNFEGNLEFLSGDYIILRKFEDPYLFQFKFFY